MAGKLKICNDWHTEDLNKLKAQNTALASSIDRKIHEATADMKLKLQRANAEINELKNNQHSNAMQQQQQQIKKMA